MLSTGWWRFYAAVQPVIRSRCKRIYASCRRLFHLLSAPVDRMRFANGVRHKRRCTRMVIALARWMVHRLLVPVSLRIVALRRLLYLLGLCIRDIMQLALDVLQHILLAGCVVNVQNICEAAVSKHRTFVALKESAMYNSNAYTSIATKVRKNLHFHLLVNSTQECMNLLIIT